MPKGDKKKVTAKEVKDIVRHEIREEVEAKYAITDYGNVILQSVIPSGNVSSAVNFFKILPDIQQSTTGAAGRKYNERVGNEIKLKSVDIHGFLSYNSMSTPAIDFENGKLAVRVMILRAKQYQDTADAFLDMPTNNLLRFGVSGGADGTRSYDGNALASFRDINRDAFAVRYDKVFYLDAPVILPGTSGGQDLALVPSAAKMFKEKLTFGKNGIKLHYTNNIDVSPNNFPYFMVIGYSSMSSSFLPDNNLVRLSMSCVGTYTDA